MGSRAEAIEHPVQPRALDDGFSLPDGSSVRRYGGTAEIRDRQGRLIVSYRNGAATIRVPDGDLTLEAPNGSVHLKSGADVTIEATGELRQRAGTLDTRATQIVTKAEYYEIEADRIIEKAQDLFREVSGFAEQRIGRLSTIVRDLYSVTSRRTAMYSEKDTSIDGKRIRLG